MEPIRKAFEAKVDDVNPGERSVVAKVTTDAVDRFREAILPKGIDLRAYLKNPIVLWSHNLQDPPVGRCAWIKPTGDGRGLVAKTIFAPTPFAMELFALYQGEFLKAFSIGGTSPEGGPPTAAELRARPDWATAAFIYRRMVLSEYSACSVGVNPEALATAVSRGLAVPDAVRRSLAGATPPTPPAPELPRLVGRTFGQAHEQLLRDIRSAAPPELARRAVQDRLDLMQGRV